MKKLLAVLSFLFLLTPIFAQEVDDAQLFGSSRGMKYYSFFSEPNITQTQMTHEFTIKNTEPVDIHIVSVNIPQGVSILVPQKTIKANSEGKIIATVYKNYVATDSAKFAKEFSVIAKLNYKNGVVASKEYKFLIAGTFK